MKGRLFEISVGHFFENSFLKRQTFAKASKVISKQTPKNCFFLLGEEKNFGSGQLIIENWSGRRFFFLNHKNFPNLMNVNECQHAEMHAEVTTWRCQVLDVR